jgi:hypothetical protein
MYPDPLSIASLSQATATPGRTATRADAQTRFSQLYTQAMQTAERELATLGSDYASDDPSDDGLSGLFDLQSTLAPGACGGQGSSSLLDGLNSLATSGWLNRGRTGAAGLLDAQGSLETPRRPLSLEPGADAPPGPPGMDRLIDWIDSHAQLHSTHRCAASVRQAMEAAGIPTSGHPGYAGDYGPFLQRHGAQAVDPASYTPQAGDIAVFDKSADHPFGHVQVFNGQHWVSDFVQQGFSPYRDPATTPPVTVYRMS